ncbi:unnamed protein product [Echinostoma caproni]|uniref:Uncharacterized protein n=1 Tax=Echinostoma caproni TaxID=27848 RepID=A0A183A3S8_9TREM|nr:unnamed protein product [Echinostoma caproni]
MVTGREIRLPINVATPRPAEVMLTSSEYVLQLRETLTAAYQLARVHLGNAQRHQKEYYDKKAHGTPVQPGEQVWLNSPTSVPSMPTSSSTNAITREQMDETEDSESMNHPLRKPPATSTLTDLFIYVTQPSSL